MDSVSGHPAGQDTAREILVYSADDSSEMLDFRPKAVQPEATPKNSPAPAPASHSASPPENGGDPAQSPVETPKNDEHSGSPSSSSLPTTPGVSKPPAVTTTPKSSSQLEGKAI